MGTFATTALWLLRRASGFGLRHVIGLAFATLLSLGVLALPFWWLGQQADTAAGALGAALVLAAYLATATVLVALVAVLVGRLVLVRMRRSLRLS